MIGTRNNNEQGSIISYLLINLNFTKKETPDTVYSIGGTAETAQNHL